MQNIQSRIPLKSLSSELAAKIKIEGKLITVLLISGEHRVTYLIRKAMAEAGSGTFALEYTDRLSTGLERLATGGIDVLLLDTSVPDSHGLDSLVWERAQTMGVPIIMLSALDDETSEIEALKKGAQEYLVKGRVAGNLLVRSIYRAIARQRLVSEREQKIQRIESSEAHLYSIIRSNPDSIIIVDHKGIVRFVNPAVESLFGCKAEQLLGESLTFLPTVKGGKTELGIIRGDGEKSVAEIQVVEMEYQGKGAYLTSLRDITERKQAEEEAKLSKEVAEARATATDEAAEVTKIASEEAVATAEEEARLAREEAEAAKTTSEEAVATAEEEARLAREEAEAAKTASEKAIAKAEEEARLAREEVEAAKTASQQAIARAGKLAEAVKKTSEEALTRAEEEARLAREEAEAAKTASEKAIAKAEEEARLAREEVKLAKEEAKTAKIASEEAIARAEEKAVAKAEEEARLAREEAEAAKTASEEAIAKAEEEARLAREEVEAAKTASQQAIARAGKLVEAVKKTSEEALTRVEEEARLAREKAEAAKTASEKVITKAEEEDRLAREEAEAAKTASEKALTRAEEEARLAREEAEAAKTASEKVITKAEEEARLAREEAEAAKTASEKVITKAEEEARLAREKAEAVKTASEEAVARAKEELRNLDPMQSEFMSNIVHELRAPLHSITGFTKLVLEGGAPDPGTQQEFLNIISDQSEHLRKLVDELTDISPVESGRIIKVRKERVSIKELLQSAVKELYSVANQKNIVLREDIPVTLPWMEVDGQRLRQVMFNLLGNAIKFSDCGGSIIVRAEVRNSDLLVQVTDQGVGITEESIPYLFEKYYQVKNSARVGGLGLGLYISKQIIETHGGRIWVESEAGAGSTFSFTLPMEQPNG